MTGTQRRRGYSLTEIVLAIGITSVMLVAVMNTFHVTQHSAVSGETLLNAGVLAQLVVDRVRSTLRINPRYLAEISATYGNPAVITGTVADPTQANNPNNLALSPFFRHLFSRNSPTLYNAANQTPVAKAAGATATGISAQEMDALFTTFRDTQVTVRIADDEDLSLASPASAFKEVVKTMMVTVARASIVAARGSDPQAYTVTTRIVAPADSLSPAALATIDDRFDGPTLPALWVDFFASSAANNPYFSPQGVTWSTSTKFLLADAFMVLAAANSEGYQVDNVAVPQSLIVDADTNAKCISDHITSLRRAAYYPFSTSKVEVERLTLLKATTIFDTFKRIRLPMADMNARILGPVPSPDVPLLQRITGVQSALNNSVSTMESTSSQMDQMAAQFDEAVATIARLSAPPPMCDALDPVTQTTVSTACPCTQWDSTLNATVTAPCPSGPSQELTDAIYRRDAAIAQMTALQQAYNGALGNATTALGSLTELTQLCWYLKQFFMNDDYKHVMPRPGHYDDWFRQALTDLHGVLTDHLNQTTGVTAYERMRVAQLYYDVTCAREIVADGLLSGPLARLTALSTQFAGTTADLSRYLAPGTPAYDMNVLSARNAPFKDMWRMLSTESPRYARVVALFHPGGAIYNFLTVHGTLADHKKLDAEGILRDVDDIIRGGRDNHHRGH